MGARGLRLVDLNGMGEAMAGTSNIPALCREPPLPRGGAPLSLEVEWEKAKKIGVGGFIHITL